METGLRSRNWHLLHTRAFLSLGRTVFKHLFMQHLVYYLTKWFICFWNVSELPQICLWVAALPSGLSLALWKNLDNFSVPSDKLALQIFDKNCDVCLQSSFYKLRILSAVNIFSCGLEAHRCLWMLGCKSRVFREKKTKASARDDLWSLSQKAFPFLSACIQSTSWAPQSQWGCGVGYSLGCGCWWQPTFFAQNTCCCQKGLMDLNSSECHQNTDSGFWNR